jgi:hypothetical protein
MSFFICRVRRKVIIKSPDQVVQTVDSGIDMNNFEDAHILYM